MLDGEIDRCGAVDVGDVLELDAWLTRQIAGVMVPIRPAPNKATSIILTPLLVNVGAATRAPGRS